MPIRLVLVDDHPVVLSGLKTIFDVEEDFQVLALCKDGEEALKAVRKFRPDILVLDLRLPGKDGLAVLREMKEERSPTKVVLYTGEIEGDKVAEAMRLGAWGLVLKELAPQLLVQCIRKVNAGEQWFERRSISLALEKMTKRDEALSEAFGTLTPREMEIVQLVIDGLRNKEIAYKLGLSEGTVKGHLYNIFQKIGVDSRVHLIRYAQNKGLK